MKIIIAGAFAIGSHLAKLLSRTNQDVVLIDEDEERLASVSGDYDLMTLHASPTSVKALKEAGVEDADLFIGVTLDESINMNSCILAHSRKKLFIHPCDPVGSILQSFPFLILAYPL